MMRWLLRTIVNAILSGQIHETEDWLDWLENNK
jgi:hypothetical protein